MRSNWGMLLKMKKILMLILMLLTMLSIGYSVYEIQYSTYTGNNINLTGGSTYRGLTINGNGSSFYYSETTTDRVFQYTCTTPYDISTCTNSGKNLSIGTLELNAFGIKFNGNGSSFYFVGSGSDTIFQYTCTTPYDISTCTNSGKNLSVVSQDNAPTSLTFNSDGSSVFMLGTTTDRVFQYTCTTSYDISTCVYTSSNLNVVSQDNSPFGITFNNEGISVLVLGNQNDNLNQYTCTTPYNLSTCIYNSSFYIGTQDLTAYGLTINSNGSSFYIVGDTNDKLFQYSIPFVNNPTINSMIMNDTSLKVGETSLLTIVFNEAVYNFSNADITTIDNGNLTSVTSSDNITWTAIFTPTTNLEDLTNVIIVTKTNINNIYNLNGVGTNSTANYQIDTLRPTISSMIMNDTSLKLGDTSVLSIVFSEPVYNFTNADITTIQNGVLSAVSSSDNITWTSTFTPDSSVEDLSNVIIVTKTNINDYFGNVGTGTNTTANYQIDTLRPTINSMIMNDTSLKVGETSLLTIVFSEAVFSFTNADFTTIDNGNLTSVTSSDNITWTSTFTPTSGVTDTTNVITLSKSNVEDSFGNAGSGSNSTANYQIDSTDPALIEILPTEYNYYTAFNFSNYITYNDSSGISSCIVTISGESSTTCNSTSYNFTTNGNKTINITTTDLAGNTNSSLNNVMLINPYQYFYFSNSSSLLNNFTLGSQSIIGQYANFTVYNSILSLGSNTLLFEKLGYATTNVTFTVNTTSSINLTTNITQSKIIVNIYDRETEQYITSGTSLVSLVATTGYNSSTTTGQVNISDINFINEEYQLLVSNTNYYSENVYFTYSNQELLTVNLYLIATNSTDLGYVIVKAINFGDEALINGAYCYALEWKPSQSAFITVASGKTNVNGETILNIELSSKLYKFSCSKDGTTTYTDSQIIQSTGTIIPIIMGSSTVSLVPEFNNLNANLTNTTLNSTYQRIRFSWNDANNVVSEGCIKIYHSVINGYQLNDTICVSSTNSFIVEDININNTYNIRVDGYLSYQNTIINIDSLSFKGNSSLAKAFQTYHLDIVLPLVFFVLGFSIGLMIKPQILLIGFVGGIIGSWFSLAIVPSIVSISLVLFINVILGTLIWATWRPK